MPSSPLGHATLARIVLSGNHSTDVIHSSDLFITFAAAELLHKLFSIPVDVRYSFAMAV